MYFKFYENPYEIEKNSYWGATLKADTEFSQIGEYFEYLSSSLNWLEDCFLCVL